MKIILYIFIGFISLLIFTHLRMRLGMFFMKGKNAPFVGGKPEDLIKKGEKVLLLFYSPLCSSCKPMIPIAEKMIEEKKNVFLMDISKHESLLKSWNIMGTPTSALVVDGKIKKFIVGYRPENPFRKLYDS